MKEELQRKYDSYRALREGYRVYRLLTIVMAIWLTIGWLPLLMFSKAMGLGVWFFVGFVLIVISKKIPSPPIEPPENAMFLNLCDALRNIEFYFETSPSKIHLTRASKHLRNFLSLLNDMIREESYSTITKAIDEPLQKLEYNLEKRILPLINYPSSQKEVQQAYLRLESLAYIFNEPTTIAQNLYLCNQILEEISESEEIAQPHGFRDRLLIFLGAHKTLRHGLVASIILIGCCVFYYIAVSYLVIQKEYVLGVSAAIFVGLLTIYFRREPRERLS